MTQDRSDPPVPRHGERPDGEIDLASMDPAELRRRAMAINWSWAQAQYIAGEPAEAVCRDAGLALSTFRRRAKLEGWRRVDLEGGASVERPSDDDADEEEFEADLERERPYAVAYARAERRLGRAVALGRATEAGAWMRLIDKLDDRVMRENVRIHRLREAEEAAAAK